MYCCSIESNVAVDHRQLAESVALAVVGDNVKAPVCLSERTLHSVNDFCHIFYDSYREHARSTFDKDNVPHLENVVHTVNLSTEDAMAAELDEIISSLRLRKYEPDAFITFSEYLYRMVQSVSCSSDLYQIIETLCILLSNFCSA